jgi:hypothetical protein
MFVAMEEVVFRRAPVVSPGEGTRGTVGGGAAGVEPLDSHENGPVSFRGGGTVLSFAGGGGGGGPHGTDGSDPWRPVRTVLAEARCGSVGLVSSTTFKSISSCIK